MRTTMNQTERLTWTFVVMITLGIAIYLFHENAVAPVPEPRAERWNVERILVRHTNDYEFYVRQEDKSLKPYPMQDLLDGAMWWHASLKVIDDVPVGQSKWVGAWWEPNGKSLELKRIEIHIHSVDDINGADWGGKNPGSTRVLQ